MAAAQMWAGSVMGVDVDGVVADLLTTWLGRYNERFDDDLKPEDITNYDVSHFVKPTAQRGIWDILNEPDLYDNVEPVPGALFGVRQLRRAGWRLVFATSCFATHFDQKHAWLIRYGFLEAPSHGFHPDYVGVWDKALLNVPYLLDDRKKTVDNFIRGTGILFKSARNPHAMDWADVVDRYAS